MISSAGGQAVTDEQGSFELAVEIPNGVSELRISAFDGAHGVGVASKVVKLSSHPTPMTVPLLQLSEAVTCQPSWIPTFGSFPGAAEGALALAVFDDGTGPALFLGGDFNGAGNVAGRKIVKWDGTTWQAIGRMNKAVTALVVYDNGSGEELIAGGYFTDADGVSANYVASWDGTEWTPLGSGLGLFVHALTTYDDGSGMALYAGGQFSSAGGNPASSLARWDGSTWTEVGQGVSGPVYALEVHDDGSEEALLVGGSFHSVGGAPGFHSVAAWDGSSWTALGQGVDGEVRALESFDDGAGPRLYVGGEFDGAGSQPASNLAAWDGSQWFQVGGGMNGPVYSLCGSSEPSGPFLYAGGEFVNPGGSGARNIARWDGAEWTELGLGLNSRVFGLVPFDPGTGSRLFACGDFARSGDQFGLENVAQWDGQAWSGLATGLNGEVRDLTVYDDGRGPALYAAGAFDAVDGLQVKRIGRWDGNTWEGLGNLEPIEGVDSVTELQVFDDGSGARLYAAGRFRVNGEAQSIAAWDGSGWTPIAPESVGSIIFDLEVFDDGTGPALYACGANDLIAGIQADILKWDGVSWTPVGKTSQGAYTMAVFDDGSGEALFVGGIFSQVDSISAQNAARWDGTSWSPVGTGIGGCFAMTVFSTGSGPRLFAGSSQWAPESHRVFSWDGTAWSEVGGEFSGFISDLAGHEGGTGFSLYATGNFNTIDSTFVGGLARWDGSEWTETGAGGLQAFIPSGGFVLQPYDDGSGEALYVGGGFLSAGERGDSYLAKLGCSTPGDPLPYCLPAGANSLSATGALLSSVSGFGTDQASFNVTDVPDQPGLLFAGDNQLDAPFGCGRRCVGGAILRGDVVLPVANQALGIPFDMSPSSAIHVQYWYRDPANAACGAAFNLSNALTPGP